jgi:hypothetical protein
VQRVLVVLVLAAATVAAPGSSAAQVPSPEPPVYPDRPILVVEDRAAATIPFGSAARVEVKTMPGVVELYAATRPSTTSRLVRRAAAPAGAAFWTVTPRANTRLHARMRGGPVGPSTTISVAQTVTLAVAERGSGYRFSGRVAPARSGVVVEVHRGTPSGAALVGRATTDAGGAYAVDRRTGSGTFTATARATADNVQGRSRPVQVAVRP